MINTIGCMLFYGLIICGLTLLAGGIAWIIKKCGKGPEIF
jgi:hypothetical protein